MIQSLRVRNLQSHKDTLLEFSPGVNIIVGQSRRGKSALFRAFEKLTKNRPITGIESWVHMQDPNNPIIIDVETTDQHSVTWEGPKDQRYILDGEEFRGFGTEVPAPVAEALNLDPINTQYQFDQPFLLFDSPGQVAKTLNRVVNLEVIDRALGNIASIKRQNDRDIQAQAARLAEIQTLEDSFPDLEAAEEFISDLESMEREKNDKDSRRSRLGSLQDDIEGCRNRLGLIQIPAGVEQRVKTLFSDMEKAEQLRYTRESLAGIQTNLDAFRSRIRSLSAALGQEAWVSELLTRNSMLARKKKDSESLKSIQGHISRARKELSAKTAIIRQMEARLQEMMPNVCPFYDRPCPLHGV